ncbi:hypothetical protein [Nonomuraea insulae]|uniref:Cytochrome bc1 complex cytochrome b subunit n=1 Tax=Nonomuraea insulae TaxID=1616787 RepID=A0ABW1CIP7_9ACTN
MNVERARQLVGEMLIYCFVMVLVTGAYLAFYYSPSGDQVAYDGGYEPLRGVMMSEAYDSSLRISFDVRGGLLFRQLHHQFSSLLVVGAVLWAMLGHFRYVLALAGLGLVVLGVLGGYGSVDSLGWGWVPIPAWYGLHLLAALTMIVTLVISARREAATKPRTPGFIVLTLALVVLLFYWPI